MAAALETVGSAEEVLVALLTGVSFLAQAAAKHTTTAITAILSNDENFVDSSDTVYILPFIFNIFEECLA